MKSAQRLQHQVSGPRWGQTDAQIAEQLFISISMIVGSAESGKNETTFVLAEDTANGALFFNFTTTNING